LIGRVLDGAGHGLGTAYVAAVADQWQGSGSVDTFWRSGLVGADGRFRIDCLSREHSMPRATREHAKPRAWQLLVRAPGMGARVFAVPVQRLAAGEVDVGDIRLAPQGIVEGRVLRSDGAPVQGAEITLRGTPDGFLALTPDGPRREPIYHLAARSTRTADDGSYRVAGLAAGGYTVNAQPEGVPWDVASSLQRVADGAIVTIPDLVADPGLTITGHVRIAGQAMLPADAAIEITADNAKSHASAKVTADGSFRLERLEPGTYILAALSTPPGFAMTPRTGVAAGSKDVELLLAPATTIEGTVVDADGKPVRGASVYFFPEGVSTARNAHSDADGRFRIEVAPGITGKVGAIHPDRESAQAHQQGVCAGTTGLVLKLSK
jgi:protocatechuate 3,4-dioxygenase beta subunit